MRRSPGFALIVILGLAVGIGAGYPILALARGTLRGPDPYADPLLRDVDGAGWLTGWTAARRTIVEIQDEALKTLVWLLLALTLLLLAVALINTLILLLTRAAANRQEIALRTAIGATYGRLTRHLLRRGASLFIIGAGAGLALGAGAGHLLTDSWPNSPAPWGDRSVDWGILTFITGLFVLIPLLAWLSPVAIAWRQDLRHFLTTGAGATPSPTEGLARQALAVMQIAALLVLLTGAGLLLRSFAAPAEELARLGFDPRDTLTIQLHMPEEQTSHEKRRLLFEAARAQISELGGVVDTSLSTPGTWIGLGPIDRVHALNGVPELPGAVLPAAYHAVSPGFFEALGVEMLHGREFSPLDDAGAPRVAIINQAFANQFRLMRNGLGIPLQLHGASLNGEWYTIVGLADDLRAEALGSGAEPVPRVYLSTLQHPPGVVEMAIRTRSNPMSLLAPITEVLHAIEPGAMVSNAMTMEEYLNGFRAPLRWFATLFGILAAATLLLAASGLHGVMAYNVTRRTREIGVRMALGARIEDITRMIFRQGLRITKWGVLLGLFGALPLGRLLQLLLGGVNPFDPWLPGGIVALLAGISAVASYRPARRAASVDPQISLRAE